jgi:hypothetical protein
MADPGRRERINPASNSSCSMRKNFHKFNDSIPFRLLADCSPIKLLLNRAATRNRLLAYNFSVLWFMEVRHAPRDPLCSCSHRFDGVRRSSLGSGHVVGHFVCDE